MPNPLPGMPNPRAGMPDVRAGKRADVLGGQHAPGFQGSVQPQVERLFRGQTIADGDGAERGAAQHLDAKIQGSGRLQGDAAIQP